MTPASVQSSHPMMPAIAIIQARMSSTRLPGKVLKPLAGIPMIEHIAQRAASCKLVDRVIVATSTETSDNALADHCQKVGIECYRGSLENVLSRYLDILSQWPYDYFVRITGDCPLIDPVFIDKQITALQYHEGDLTWLTDAAPILGGQGVHSSKSLEWIASNSSHPDDLEHVGSRYLSEHPEEFRIIGMQPPTDLTTKKWRITVDETADYEMMHYLYASLWKGEPISITQALEWMEQNPELSSSNQAVQHSAINQELSAKRREWLQHIDFFCDWEDPSELQTNQ